MALLEREESLARLSELFLATKDGRGRLALVAGEAGIGKTVLVDAFCATRRDRTQILWGTCDAVVPPRTFAPLVDIADRIGGSLRVALEVGDRDAVFNDVLARLGTSVPLQRILVLEDLHWADEATLDLLRVIGRRLRSMPVMVIGTYRDDEVAPDHPLRLALGDVPSMFVVEIPLRPLSVAGVGHLAAGTGMDPVTLHQVTGGNPFFVTEAASAATDEVPASVRDAVFARAARLSSSAQDVLRAASVLRHRFEADLVRRLSRRSAAAVHECLASGMLLADGDVLQFRHELAQRAMRDALSPSACAALHARVLDLLIRMPATDPEELAYHAIGADDARQALTWAPAAARQAAMLGAHRQAAAHYAAALTFTQARQLQTRAELLEGEGRERLAIDEVETALARQRTALDCWRQLGDVRREGDGLRALSQMLWFAGSTDQATDAAQQAVDLLSTLPPGPELARAYATVAQRWMTSGRDDAAALSWAERANDLAETLGEEAVAVHAQTTIGVLQTFHGNEAGWAMMEGSLRRAQAAGLDEDAVRALINLVEMARDMRRYELADQYRDEAMRYLAEHNLDLDLLRRRLVGDLAEIALERGRWDEAADLAELLLGEPETARRIRVSALTVLGRLRARRGDADAWALLDEGLALAGPESDAEVLIPLYAARIEAAWLTDDTTRAGDEARLALALASNLEDAWLLGELAFWAWRVGALDALPDGTAAPFALHAAGHHSEAAAAWEAVGCPYQAAHALAESRADVDQRRALEIFIALGARPMTRRLTGQLRLRGARGIRRGPRHSTRANPAQLTPRELEVLALVAKGLRNADIAERMVLSVKTVDHHVSSILRKLGVKTRAAAARDASRLGLKDGEPPVTT
jgi:DNA-binding CsgD family transcriptional regulator